MDKLDITVIINLHREGMFACPSVLSIARAKSFAEKRGVKIEVIAVLDAADEITRKIVEDSDLGDLQTIHVQEGDLGAARNWGVRSARGDWIAFLDADDLWGEEWLSAAYRASRDPRQIVWHTEVNLFFGETTFLFHHLDMEDPKFEPLSLLLSNYWTSACFARRSLLLEIPYRKISLIDQIGYEDWGWHMETISRGVLHKIVPGTAHAIRMRQNSLGVKTRAAGALPYPAGSFPKIVLDPKTDS